MIDSNTKQGETSQTNDEQQQRMTELITKCLATTYEDSISSLIEFVRSADLEKQYYGMIGLRKALCEATEPLIEEVLDSGITPRLIEIMKESKEPKIQLQAAWSLSNLCSGASEQTERAIDFGVISDFLSALTCGDSALIEQCIFGLGNIAAGSSKARDLIISEGGIEAIANVLENTTTLSTKKHGAWALSNCCRGPPYEKISKAIPVFCKLAKNEDDREILADSLWVLAYNSEGNNEVIETILNNGVIPIVVKLLSNCISLATLVIPCLQLVGNMLSGSDEQTSLVLQEKDLFSALLSWSKHKKRAITKEVFWVISHITAGKPEQIESIMGDPAFVERIIAAASKYEFEDIRIGAICALSNSTAMGTPAQIIRLLDNGVFKCLIGLLDEANDDESIVLLALEGIENCLKWGAAFNLVDENGENKFVVELKEQGGLSKLHNLEMHESIVVHERSTELLETYF